VHSRSSSRRRPRERAQSALALQLRLGLFVPERLLGFARGGQGRGERLVVVSQARGLGVLLRFGRGAQHRLLARIVADHALRRSPDLALAVGDVVAGPGLEDPDLAGGGPLHGAEGVSACLRVP